LFVLSPDSERADLDSSRTIRPRFGGVDEGKGDARHHLFQEFLVLLARHVRIELHPLDPGLRETVGPFPVSDLAQGSVLVDGLLPEE